MSSPARTPVAGVNPVCRPDHGDRGRTLNALLPAGHPFVMSFEGPRMSVQGGCNQQNGAWRLSP
jgi:hypothetical protein